MAISHLRITPLSRAQGVNALQAAARYAAAVLIDHRSGETYDFSDDPGVVHQEILTPRGFGMAVWDRQRLWTAAEQAEVRKDARIAREYQIGLPHELSDAARIDLARRWGRFIVERHGNGADLTVRLPPVDGDPRNHYAIVMATTRQLSATGLGAKACIEFAHGEQSGPKEYGFLHRQWKQLLHEALLATLTQEHVG